MGTSQQFTAALAASLPGTIQCCFLQPDAIITGLHHAFPLCGLDSVASSKILHIRIPTSFKCSDPLFWSSSLGCKKSLIASPELYFVPIRSMRHYSLSLLLMGSMLFYVSFTGGLNWFFWNKSYLSLTGFSFSPHSLLFKALATHKASPETQFIGPLM